LPPGLAPTNAVAVITESIAENTMIDLFMA